MLIFCKTLHIICSPQIYNLTELPKNMEIQKKKYGINIATSGGGKKYNDLFFKF